MSVTADLAIRCKIADPKPSHCCRCYRAGEAGVRFVDFDAAIDRGAFADANSLAIMDSIDDLVMCEDCVREGAQLLNLKPDLHQKQLREIRRLELERDHWKDYAQRLEQTVALRPEPVGRRRS